METTPEWRLKVESKVVDSPHQCSLLAAVPKQHGFDMGSYLMSGNRVYQDLLRVALKLS